MVDNVVFFGVFYKVNEIGFFAPQQPLTYVVIFASISDVLSGRKAFQ